MLKEPFGGRLISLPLFDVAQVEQARSVVGIELEALLEISSGLVEASQVPVRESQSCIGGSRGVEADQNFELLNGLLHSVGHEIAFAQGGVKIGAFRSDFQARFQQRDRVFEITLRHAEAGQKER